MSDQWFYLTDGVQGGPVDLPALCALASGGTVNPASLMWRDGMADWIPASAACPEVFAPRTGVSPPTVAVSASEPTPQKVEWFYLVGDAQKGPVEIVRLQELGRGGEVTRATLVWKEGLTGWGPAGYVPELAALLPVAPPTPPSRPSPPPVPRGAARRGFLAGIGARISEVADLPTISNVPIRDILIGGIDQAAKAKEDDVEDEFALGTRATTPPLSEVQTGWPRARTAWRVWAGS